MQSFLLWLEASWLNHLVVDSAWMFPALETLHFLGLILLVGSLLVVDVRLLGFGRRVSVNAVLAFLPWSLLGFVINLCTGVLFFASDPQFYYSNAAFRLKMLAVVLAGLNAIWFKRAIHPHVINGAVALPASTPIIAGASLLLWGSVIVFGRLIPYLH